MPRAPVVSHRSHHKPTWEEAARIQGKSLTDFIEDIVTPVAQTIVKNATVADHGRATEESVSVR